MFHNAGPLSLNIIILQPLFSIQNNLELNNVFIEKLFNCKFLIYLEIVYLTIVYSLNWQVFPSKISLKQISTKRL